MHVEAIYLFHLFINFSVAVYVLRKRGLLKWAAPLAVTSLWPASIFVLSAYNRGNGGTTEVADWIVIYSFAASPIIQVWVFRNVCEKFFCKREG
jgi:hypothetical protein